MGSAAAWRTRTSDRWLAGRWPHGAADITAVSGSGTVTSASYVTRARGVSCMRHEGARVNRLTLAEEERMALACGLGRVEPLQRQRLRRRAVGDRHLAGLGRELELELLAKDGLVIAERIGDVDGLWASAPR